MERLRLQLLLSSWSPLRTPPRRRNCICFVALRAVHSQSRLSAGHNLIAGGPFMPDSEALLQKLDSRIDSIDKKLADARTERKNSQILMSIFTALITSFVGFAAWFAQSRVQQHIDEKSKDL